MDGSRKCSEITPEPGADRGQLPLQASDLAASLLADCASPGEAVRGCLQRTLMLKIKDYIGQRLCDPGLRPRSSGRRSGLDR